MLDDRQKLPKLIDSIKKYGQVAYPKMAWCTSIGLVYEYWLGVLKLLGGESVYYGCFPKSLTLLLAMIVDKCGISKHEIGSVEVLSV